MTGYTLALSAFLIVAGRLADIYGRRAVLVAGAGLFAAGSAVAALAPSGAVLIAGLVIAGLGGAALIPSSLSIVLNAYAPSERGLPLGIWGGATALGPGLRAADRRRAHRRARLGVDLLVQRRRGRRHRAGGRGVSRRSHATRRRSAGSTSPGSRSPSAR